MARILENPNGRRLVSLSIDDVFAIISTYQKYTSSLAMTYDQARVALVNKEFYLPEEL